MMRKSLFAVTLVLSVLVAGCGGGGSTSSSATPTPVLSVSPSTTLTFASTTVGTTNAATQSFTFTNSGTGTLTLGSYLQTGATTSFVETTASTCGATSSLTAGQSCTLVIAFTPQSAGALTETITATDNTSAPNVTLTLTGTGVAVATVPQATLSGSAIAFNATTVGTATAAQTITLTNTGNGPLTISSVVLGGVNLDQFTETNNCPASLAAAGFCTLSIAFSPTQVGTFSAVVTVTDNSGNVAGSTQTISLSGTSNGAIASLSPTSITFAATTLNTAAGVQTVTLSNTGSAALTGIGISITGGATASAFTITGTTCGTTLAAGASCTISVNFTPTIVGTFLAYLSVADNAPGSPQTVALNGTGQTAPAPLATLSSTSISFLTTLPGTTSAPSSVTLTNTGGATLNIASIALGGTGAANFTKSTTCGATLAAAANCTISATFSPTTASAYTATITLTDNNNNVANSTQTIALSGTGGTNTTYHTLYVVPESDNSVTPLYALVNAAAKTIDMTMYALEDTTFTADLVAACKRGVVVRVILDQNNEKSGNTSAFNSLNAQTNCSAVWANKAFAVTHEKSIMIDGVTDVVMSLNLQSQYYSTTRDYALVDNDANDYAADEATFSMDYAAGTNAAGTVGASDFSYAPGPGDDLVWSPTTATADMLAIINNSTKTLYIECEEFSAPNIVSAVASAAQRGVAVVLVGENESGTYTSDYATIKAAGAKVYYYSSSTGFYIHAKSVVADLGLATEAVYVGSINYSTASLTSNRELGVYITGNTAVSNPIAATLAATTIADETGSGVTKY
jgi:phosphatidylserine/phosphatidylglycerophosphate/cardiolipin synthase-like enzyme